MCGVKSCCTAVSVVLLYCCTAVLLYMVYCSCCLGATTPGRPRPLHPPYPLHPLHPPLRGRWYLRGQMAILGFSCPAPAPLLRACNGLARAMLQGLCCRGYAGAMQDLCRGYAGATQGLCRSFAGAVQELCRDRAGAMQGLCRGCAGAQRGLCRGYTLYSLNLKRGRRTTW